MNLAMTTFGAVHTLISLVGIVSGLVVVSECSVENDSTAGRRCSVDHGGDERHRVRLPVRRLAAMHKIGIISLVVLAVQLSHATSPPRRTLALDICVCAVAALYSNVFVLIVQLFRRVPALAALAPTQTEPPFAVRSWSCWCCSSGLDSPVKRFRRLPTPPLIPLPVGRGGARASGYRVAIPVWKIRVTVRADSGGRHAPDDRRDRHARGEHLLDRHTSEGAVERASTSRSTCGGPGGIARSAGALPVVREVAIVKTLRRSMASGSSSWRRRAGGTGGDRRYHRRPTATHSWRAHLDRHHSAGRRAAARGRVRAVAACRARACCAGGRPDGRRHRAGGAEVRLRGCGW